MLKAVRLSRLLGLPLRAPLLSACAVLCLLLFSTESRADKWPGRAGGDSASGDPELLLTFDDGPHEKHTRSILDTLEAHEHQAIFFWTGHRVLKERRGLDERLALVVRTVASGHLVGNHTISHAKLCTVSADQAAEEIDEAGRVFEGLTDLPMLLFRVPYGARCRRLDKMMEERQLMHLHWDLDPQEFRHHSVDTTVRYVTKRMSRLADGQRAVLLMHDTQPVTAKALPKILEWIEGENEKRAVRGRRPIRVIEPSSWVAENYALPIFAWGRRSVLASGRALRAAASFASLR